jgi:hypothetical protein
MKICIRGSVNRLNSSDADYVDIIHTDGTIGLRYKIGHKDFYPNGGSFQTGCNLLDLFGKQNIQIDNEKDFNSLSAEERAQIETRFNPLHFFSCSHSRSVELYVESISQDCVFTGVQCSSYGTIFWKKSFFSLINNYSNLLNFFKQIIWLEAANVTRVIDVLPWATTRTKSKRTEDTI